MIEVTIENRDLDIEATGETRTETFQISRNSIFQGNPGEKGEKGDKGDKGDKGNTGDIGPRGLQGNDAKINGYNAIHLEGDDRRINVGPEASDPTRFHIQFDDTGLLTDAPSDDKQYARKNGQWTVVTGGGGGTSDYNDLENKPTINGRELVGDQTGEDLGLYTFPDNGIPESDLDADAQAKLNSRTVATFEYGVSRFEDILAAYNAGKVCELDFDGYKYRLCFISNYEAGFSGTDYDDMYNGFVYICLSNDTWQTTEVNYASNSYVETKQDIISDLATIRSNAAEGAAIAPKVPSQASSTNQLADKAFVNSSIQNVAAYYITKDAAGNPFATKAELLAATTFYSGGQVRVPTRNDYLVVLADESKTIAETGENPTTRYIYDNNVWSYQYIVNRSGLTAAQWAAVNSGITSEEVARLAEVDNNIYPVTCNVTTKAEVDAAVAAGKLPVCIYNDRCYIYSGISNGYATFLCLQTTNNIVHYYRLYLKTSWGEANIVLAQDGQCEKTDNKVTSISMVSTDMEYPSAKCVYDITNELAVRISDLENSGTPVQPINIVDGVATITGNTFGTMGALDEDVTFELADYDGDDLCEYHWTFAIGEDIASITWPEGMQWQGGNVPTINANKTYEVSIIDSLAVAVEF